MLTRIITLLSRVPRLIVEVEPLSVAVSVGSIIVAVSMLVHAKNMAPGMVQTIFVIGGLLLGVVFMPVFTVYSNKRRE